MRRGYAHSQSGLGFYLTNEKRLGVFSIGVRVVLNRWEGTNSLNLLIVFMVVLNR